MEQKTEQAAPFSTPDVSQAEAMFKAQPTAKSNYYIGLAYYKQGQYTLAIPYFQHALKIAPQYQGPRYYLASAYDAVGNYRQAVSELQTLAQQPHIPKEGLADIYLKMGVFYADMHDELNAERAYNQSIKYDPHNAEAYYGKSLIAGRTHKYNLARNDIRLSLSNTNNKSLKAALHEYLGEIQDDLHNHAAAQREYRTALELDPTNELAKKYSRPSE